MDSHGITGQRTRRGFNLIESAIVLGVVGLIIGGIWVAASAVSEKQKINDLTSGVVLGAEKLRNLITPASLDPDGQGWTHIENVCRQANIFPSFPVENGKIQNPFGSVMSGFTVHEDGWGVVCAMYGNNVVILLPLPTTGLCQKVIASITSKYKNNSELALVWIGGNNNVNRHFTNWPISPTGTECSGLVLPINIRLFYTMKRLRP